MPEGPSRPTAPRNPPREVTTLSVQRLAIAKLAAQKSPKETAKTIRDFGLSSSQRFQVAKWIGQLDPVQIIKNIGQFDLPDEELFEIAKMVALRKPREMAQAIKRFPLENLNHRFEIAKIVAMQGIQITDFIHNFDIYNRALRFELAKVAAEKEGWECAKHLERFDLTLPQQTQIMKMSISNNPRALGFADSVFGDAYIDLIRLMGTLLYEDDDVLELFKETISHYLSEESCSSLIELVDQGDDLDVIDNKIAFIASALYIWKQTLTPEEFTWVDDQKWIEKILPIRDFQSAYKLIESVSQSAQYQDQFENLFLKIETKYKWGALLKLSLARLKNSGVDPQPLIDCLNTTCFRQLKDLVKFCSLLKTLELFSQDTELSSDEKSSVLKVLSDHPKQLFDLAKDLLMILECKKSAKLKNLSEQRSLSDLAEEALLEVLPIPTRTKNLKQQVHSLFGAYRQPNAIRRLTGKLFQQKNPQILVDLGAHIASVLNKNYRSQRYSTVDNPHLSLIPKDTLKKWRVNSRLNLSEIIPIEDEKNKNLVIIESDDPEDFFHIGLEGDISCMSADEEFGHNMGLIGYLRHGQTRFIAIKNGKKGPILARAILRLLHDGEKPVLFMEKIYAKNPDKNFDRAIISMAKRASERLGCPLTALRGARPYPKQLHSYGGPAAKEYSDGAKGLSSAGRFTLKKVKFID